MLSLHADVRADAQPGEAELQTAVEPDAPPPTPTGDAQSEETAGVDGASAQAAPPSLAAAPPAALDPPARGGTTPAVQAVDHELPPAPPDRRRGKKGLLITGLSIFGGSYLFSVLVGMTLLSEQEVPADQTCTNCDKGKLLLVPLLGPWLMLPHADGTDGKAVSSLLGIIQGTGAILLIAGIVKYSSSTRSQEAHAAASKLALGAAPTPGGAHASLRLRF